MTTRKASRFVVGGSGLVAPKTIRILANRTYFLGASSSPAQVYVLSVTDEVVTYVRCSALKFDRENAQIIRTQRWIAEDLIARGTATFLGMIRNAMKSGTCEWYERAATKLEAQLAGQETAAEDLDTFRGVTINLVATSPVDQSKGRDGDPWYAAEEYGNTSGRTMADGTFVYTVETTIAEARAARNDPRFRVVSLSEVDGAVVATAA